LLLKKVADDFFSFPEQLLVLVIGYLGYDVIGVAIRYCDCYRTFQLLLQAKKNQQHADVRLV
jgi:hypothetical protein